MDEKTRDASAALGTVRQHAAAPAAPVAPRQAAPDPFLRAENEDDDGYDPYSDRPATREPLFERDPWA